MIANTSQRQSFLQFFRRGRFYRSRNNNLWSLGECITLPMMGRNISSSLIDDLQEIFDACFPKVGSVIGIAAVIILLATLVLDLPQLAALISQIPFFEENLGSFESP